MTEINGLQQADVLNRLMAKGLSREQAQEKIASFLKKKGPQLPAVPTEVAAELPTAPEAPKVTTSDEDKPIMTDTKDTTAEVAATPTATPKAPKAPKAAAVPKAPRVPKEPHESLWLPLYKAEMEALDAHLASLPEKTSRAKFAKALVLKALGL